MTTLNTLSVNWMEKMTQSEALKIQAEIESICKRYGLWWYVEHAKKPELDIIRIKEISIKVDKK